MIRRSAISIGMVLVTIITFTILLQAGNQKAKSNLISGILIDTKCYAMGAFVINDHKDMKGKPLPNCATACAVMGIPVAVLDKDKNVHIIAGPAGGYSKWMAMEVRLKGMHGKYADVFIPESIEVKEKGKWVKKDLPGAMM